MSIAGRGYDNDKDIKRYLSAASLPPADDYWSGWCFKQTAWLTGQAPWSDYTEECTTKVWLQVCAAATCGR